ncbi:MAG: class I SAM-dependent methyltransferase [Saprospirales bacterium]|nr:class I SAM-dependent methyltransferase [Saprospirales bacterium]MBK8492046.1 class I SAM-dependent methyltransferase [Saprospirales bacterium]
MKKWILKAVIQKIISWLPYPHRINYLFQQYVTRGVRLSEEYLDDKLIHFRNHIRFSGDPSGKTILELGTGWYPIVPVCFFLTGAERIHTVDITPFLTAEKVQQTLRELIRLEGEERLQQFLKPLPERWEQLNALSTQQGLGLNDLLTKLHIQYHIADARHLSLEPHSIDLITSNNTFEHVYPEILEAILEEFKRVLEPDGLMSHFIDMSDHFAHLDPTITIYHFLRFSKKQWSWIDNTIQPQNRWRIVHYRQLYQQLGISIIKEENRPGDVIVLRTVPIHREFSGIPESELAVSHSYLVSR